jgi:GT2 family glycosyltransferase
MTSPPSVPARVAVVIPYGGGAGLLLQQLRALELQQGGNAFTVIVSCNRDGLADELDGYVRQFRRYVLRIVDSSDVAGPSHARNVGWKAADADLICFCDADDVVGDRWVMGHVEALQEHGLSRGPIDYVRLNAHGVSLGSHASDAPPRAMHHLPFSPSCSLGARRSVLEAIGGFDEELRSGEDIDLCWRAQYAGVSLGYASTALLHYRVKTGFSRLVSQGRQYGAGDVELLRRHAPHGARHGLTDDFTDVARLGYFAVASLLGRPGSKEKLATRIGTSLGRLLASSRSGRPII